MPVEMMHITLAGNKFSSGTLPTMHSIYEYTDIYQGLKILANSYIYIAVCKHFEPNSYISVYKVHCGKVPLENLFQPE